MVTVKWFRFDNVAMAMLTIYDDATIDNWSDNMHFAADSNGENLLYLFFF